MKSQSISRMKQKLQTFMYEFGLKENILKEKLIQIGNELHSERFEI